jgi:rhomboid protease GluP
MNLDQKMMREFVEKKLQRGGYSSIAATDFPCGVWIKKDTDTQLYVVCLFDDAGKLAADRWRIDRVMDYAAQKVREQNSGRCQFLALVLSEDFSVSKQLLEGSYPRWFVDGDGQMVIFDDQPSEFCDLYPVLTRKETLMDRFKGKGISVNRIPEATLILVILNVIIQCIVAVGEIGGKDSALLEWMVLRIGPFIQKPEWWRLATSVFLHFGWEHLFNNMLVLLYLGSLAERCLGKKRFLAVYLFSGIGANIVSVWWYVHQGELLVATAGASGAIFGIAGLLLGIVLLSKGRFEGITLRQLVLMMFFTLYHGFAESGVNNCAHIAGGVIGFVCGILIFLQMRRCKAAER